MQPIHMKKILLVLLLPVLLVSCSKKEPLPSVDDGYIEGNTYYNEYFGLSLEIPETWIIQNREMLEHFKDITNKGFHANDDSVDRAIKKTIDERTKQLLLAFQYEVGAPVEFNPSVMIIAEDISITPGIKTASDYHYHAKSLLENSNMKATFDRAKSEKTLTGFSFESLPVNFSINNLEIKQDYYTMIVDRNVLMITVSYLTDEQKLTVESILDTLKSTK